MARKTIDREFLRKLRLEINDQLAVVAARHSITLEAGNASFTDSSCTFKLLGTVVGAPTQHEQRWDMHAEGLGLMKFWLGRKITYGRHGEYVVRGLAPRCRTVLLEQAGTMYRMGVDSFIELAKLV